MKLGEKWPTFYSNGLCLFRSLTRPFSKKLPNFRRGIFGGKFFNDTPLLKKMEKLIQTDKSLLNKFYVTILILFFAKNKALKFFVLLFLFVQILKNLGNG